MALYGFSPLREIEVCVQCRSHATIYISRIHLLFQVLKLAKNGEFDLSTYVDILFKEKYLITAITVLIVFTFGLVSANLPKVYESEAIIRIGTVDGKYVMSPFDAKSFMQGSFIVEPVVREFYDDALTVDKLGSKYVVEVIKEDVDVRTTEVTSYLRIKLRSDDPVKSRDMAVRTANISLKHANLEYERRLDAKLMELRQSALLVDEAFNESVRLAIKEKETREANLKQQMREREKNIKDLEDELSALTDKIDNNYVGGLSPEDVAIVGFLESIHRDLRENLHEEREKKMMLDAAILKEQTDLEQDIASQTKKRNSQQHKINSEINKLQANSDPFKVVLVPQIQRTPIYPSMKLNLVISLFLGFTFAFVYSAIRHKKRKK